MHCFVIMPFGDAAEEPEQHRRWQRIYSQWVKPAVESVRVGEEGGDPLPPITCRRGDEDSRSGEVILHIVEDLISADIVIADLTGRNPNVFYELGVRHAVANNTILVAQNIDDVPFDLRLLRVITYQYEPEAMLRFREAIQAAVAEVLRSQGRIDNPVRRHLSEREAQRIISVETPPGFAETKELLLHVDSLRRDLTAQNQELRRLVELVAVSDPMRKSVPTLDVASLQGTWTTREHGGLYCIRQGRDGRLLVPYCYSSDRELTGHLFDLYVIDSTIFGRFKWFDSPIRGFIMLRVRSTNLMEGGWWYAEDVPRHLQNQLTQLNEGIDAMNKITHVRTHRNTIPLWAENYFAHK